MQQQHFNHVGLLIDDRAVGTDQHHQAIADEKSDQARQHGNPCRAREACPVGGLGRAADEGAEHQRDRGRPVQRTRRHHAEQTIEATDFYRRDPHRQHQQQHHRRHRDVRQDLQAAITDIRRGAEHQAEQHHQAEHCALPQIEVFAEHHGGGRSAPGVPADLGETEAQVTELAADFTKTETPHQHGVKSALEGDITEACRIQTEQQVTDDDHRQHLAKTEGDPKLAAGEHGCGEKRETKQHHGGRGQAFSRMHRDFAEGVVVAGIVLRHGAFLAEEGGRGLGCSGRARFE